MEDVIFAGTSSRPALGRAEVSLTVDNASGKLPVDMAEVTISRTLFRSGDSEYAINGTPCRLLDIQDLLSDSGVGRQQHMIIGQGQLDAVLSARPEDRRALIEEAAGVLKHRRRRERAERRLEATRENLERLGDLVRELRRQIRPLERQAAAARSHAAIATELRAVRVHLAGTELADLDRRRQEADSGLAGLAAEELELHRALADLDVAATTVAAELASRREEDLASALGRVQALVERARGTTNVLRERARALGAALDAAADVDVVSTLEAEASRLAAELEAAREESNALSDQGREVAARAAALDADERGHAERWGDAADVTAAGERLREGRGRIGLQQRALDQGRRELARLDDRVAALARRLAEVDAAAARLDDRVAALDADASRLSDAAGAAGEAHRLARARSEEAETAIRSADRERHRSAARAEALARALHELQGAGGREILAGVDGVVGSLVDLVEIDEGWEAAFEAAAGAAVVAVVVSGREAAHRALARLHRQGATGALLAARVGPGTAGPGAAGASLLTDLPDGAEPVRPHVHLRAAAGLPGSPGPGPGPGPGAPGLSGVLDALVGRAVRVAGWERAVDLALDRPELVVVTAEGDRFADSGWRVRSTRGVVTAATVEEAADRAAAAATAADAAAERLDRARRELEEASAADVVATRALDRHEADRVTAAAERARTGEDRARVAAEIDECGRGRAESAAGVDADATALEELERAVPDLEAKAGAAVERAEAAARDRAELDGRRAEVDGQRRRLEVGAAGVAERQRVLERRHAEVERRLAGHAEEREAAAARRVRLEADGVAVDRLGAVVGRERGRLEAVLDALRTDYRQQVERIRAGGERLEAIRRHRSVAEGRQAELGERSRRLDREVAEVSLRREALQAMVRTELG
ncbi:MAG: hypothetical protein ACRDWN_07015, partial [Acidimicrobiales bacterium]